MNISNNKTWPQPVESATLPMIIPKIADAKKPPISKIETNIPENGPPYLIEKILMGK